MVGGIGRDQDLSPLLCQLKSENRIHSVKLSMQLVRDSLESYPHSKTRICHHVNN